MKTPAGLDERCRQDPWSQANQGGPKKNPTAQESLFEAGMFRQWGYRAVDYDLESKAGLRVEEAPGAGERNQSVKWLGMSCIFMIL